MWAPTVHPHAHGAYTFIYYGIGRSRAQLANYRQICVPCKRLSLSARTVAQLVMPHDAADVEREQKLPEELCLTSQQATHACIHACRAIYLSGNQTTPSPAAAQPGCPLRRTVSWRKPPPKTTSLSHVRADHRLRSGVFGGFAAGSSLASAASSAAGSTWKPPPPGARSTRP